MKLDKAVIGYTKEIAALREEIAALREDVREILSLIDSSRIEMVDIGEIDLGEEIEIDTKSKRKKAKV